MARKKRKTLPPGSPEVETSSSTEEDEGGDFETILDADPNGLLVIEAEERKILWANRAAERLLKKKRDKLFAEPFPEELEEGPMRSLDLNRKLQGISWSGQDVQLLTLSPIQSGSASFALEWRLEAAEERAREAEEQLDQLRAQIRTLKKAASSPEREQELQAELSASLERVQALEKDVLQLEERADRAETRAREAETLMEEAESQAQETERSLEDLSDSVRQVEEQLESTRQELRAETALREELERQWSEAAPAGSDDEIAALREQSQLLQMEIDDLLQRLADQEQQASGQLDDVQQQLAAARQEREEWLQRQTELEELEGVHLQVLTELEQLRQSQDASGSQDAVHIAEAEAARDRLRRLEEDLELQQLECEELQEKLTDAEQARAQADQRVEELRASTENLEEQLLELQALLEEEQRTRDESADSLRAESAARIQELEAQLDARSSELAEVEQLRSDFEDVQQHLVGVEKERDELLLKLDEVEAEQADSEHQSGEFERQLEEKAAETEALATALADLESQLDKVQDELSQARAEQAELEGLKPQVEELENQKRLLQEQLDDLVEQIDQAGHWEGEATTLQSECERLRQQVAELETRAQASGEELQAAAGAHLARIAELEGQFENDQLEISELQSRLEEASQAGSQREAAQVQVAELTAQLDGLRAPLEESQARIAELTAQLEAAGSLAAELDAARAELAELSARLEAARAENEELQAQVDPGALHALQGKWETSQVEVAQLRMQLQAAEARASEAESAGGGLPAVASIPESPVGEDSGRIAELEEQLQALQQQLQERDAGGASEEGFGPPALGDRETEQLAFEDSLTKLPNFNLLRRYLDYSLKQVDRYQRRCALVHVDLDRFQAVNEALGSDAGDEVLRQVAERLQKVVRTSDVLCRKSEDDFLILLSEVAGEADSPESISVVIKRIQEMMAPPVQAGQQPVLISVSIGVSQFPSDAEDGDQMLTHAAAAVRRAKEMGRNQVQFYTEDLQKRHEARATLESELRRGIEARQFQLLYQPIVHLPTGRVAGVESLLRWNHPSYGVLTPEYFLDVAEDSGLLNPIGRQVIVQAAQQLYEWARQGLDMFVTVNLSTRQFLQADLVDTIRRALEATGAPAHNFVVEIPESVQMLDIQRVQTILLALRQAGVRVALDRFGSGFSSLERLHSELITLLKVDRKFLFHAATNAAALNVTVAALGLARGLRLRPVAVGVENETQLSLCRQLECEYVQGNLVYVPTDAAQVSELARAGRLLR